MAIFIFIAIDCADKAEAQQKRGKKPTHATSVIVSMPITWNRGI